ncbi:MAG: hypothetical protein RR508_06035 [Oscillospiraceae bacterium]
MMSKIKQEIYLCKDNFIGLFLIMLGGWVFGFIVASFVYIFAKEDAYANVGVLMGLMFTAIFYFMFIIMSFSTGLELAVSMGRTRKDFIITELVSMLALGVASLAELAFLSILDMMLGKLFFPRLSFDETFINIFSFDFIKIALPVLIGIMCVGIFIAATVQRFGKKAFWIFYFIMMSFFLFGGSIGKYIKADDRSTLLGNIVCSISDAFTALGSGGIIILVCAAALVALGIGVALLRKATIKA